MKNYLLLLTLSSALISELKAQDQLYKKDNTKLLVKITEINPDEIKYKLFDNQSGPTYVVAKNEVSLIVYENGQHEVIKSTSYNEPARLTRQPGEARPSRWKEDSLKYFRYSESISLNFLTFLNNEVGLIYQKDFHKNNFNIIIPVGVGLERPSVTQSIYFSRGLNNVSNGVTTNNSTGIELNKKMFEVGLGVNYFPSVRTAVQYYVGPTLRYMQYASTQTYIYRTTNQGWGSSGVTINKNVTLSRYCVSITNGLVFRTKSRLVLSLFGSIGFKNDVVSSVISDPNTGVEINPINEPFSIYWWSGFNIGIAF